MRFMLVFVTLALLFLVPFLLLGEDFDTWFTRDGAKEWLEDFGAFAWAMALVLLVGDLVLPVPASAVMAALGIVYGPVAGGLIGGAGSMLSGLIAYGICRAAGRKAALWLAEEKDLKKGEAFFARTGGWAVALSRWLPLLPEVIACMAGLARMPFFSFLAALACGSLPMALTFAALGHAGSENPLLAMGLCALVPLLLWAAAGRFLPRGAG